MTARRYELTGRGAETALLHEFVSYLGRDGTAMLLTGQPGVGKTALLLAAADLASSAGATVHMVTPTEFASPDPFMALARLLSPLRGLLGELPRNAQSALKIALGLRDGPPARREALAAATLTLLQHASLSGPLLLLVDDAHWLDPASAEVIGFAARRLRGSRAGVLAAVRAGTHGSLRLAGLPEREVRPIAPSDAHALLRNRFPQLTPAVRERIVEEAGGLPLALLEMQMALTSAQRS